MLEENCSKWYNANHYDRNNGQTPKYGFRKMNNLGKTVCNVYLISHEYNLEHSLTYCYPIRSTYYHHKYLLHQTSPNEIELFAFLTNYNHFFYL